MAGQVGDGPEPVAQRSTSQISGQGKPVHQCENHAISLFFIHIYIYHSLSVVSVKNFSWFTNRAKILESSETYLLRFLIIKDIPTLIYNGKSFFDRSSELPSSVLAGLMALVLTFCLRSILTTIIFPFSVFLSDRPSVGHTCSLARIMYNSTYLTFLIRPITVLLFQYLDQLAPGNSKVRIFLPMCGKAGDLMYLYQVIKQRQYIIIFSKRFRFYRIKFKLKHLPY